MGTVESDSELVFEVRFAEDAGDGGVGEIIPACIRAGETQSGGSHGVLSFASTLQQLFGAVLCGVPDFSALDLSKGWSF